MDGAIIEIQRKTALVTGGAQRVGKAIILGPAQHDVNVVVNFNRSAAAALETAAEAQAFGMQAASIQCGVSGHEQIKGMVEEVTDTFGSLYILVNSASWF